MAVPIQRACVYQLLIGGAFVVVDQMRSAWLNKASYHLKNFLMQPMCFAIRASVKPV